MTKDTLYAIIETGGKQYRAEAGRELDVEKLGAEPGKKVKLEKVLLVSGDGATQIGRPYVKGAFVEAEIVRNYRDAKVISYKAIRREGGAKTKIGHRQYLTRVRVLAVKAA
jgi:large subunit ribosomal protein L21